MSTINEVGNDKINLVIFKNHAFVRILKSEEDQETSFEDNYFEEESKLN
jgi:hypothetical protein